MYMYIILLDVQIYLILSTQTTNLCNLGHLPVSFYCLCTSLIPVSRFQILDYGPTVGALNAERPKQTFYFS